MKSSQLTILLLAAQTADGVVQDAWNEGRTLANNRDIVRELRYERDLSTFRQHN